MSLIRLLAEGGCYWKRLPDGVGHSLAFARGTRFRIKLDGPNSHRYASGKCLNGLFVLDDGREFASANEAVNSLRAPSSNAYIHIDFEIGGQWESADTLRHRPEFELPETEEKVLQYMKDAVRNKARTQKRQLTLAEVTQKAAQVILDNAEKFQELDL